MRNNLVGNSVCPEVWLVRVTNALLKELRSPSTVLLALGLFLFELAKSEQIGRVGSSNLWDVLVATTSDSHFLVLGVLLWWVNVLMQTARERLTELALIRFGCRIRILNAALKTSVLRLCAAFAILTAVALPVAARTGLSWQWSPAAVLVDPNQELDVFSAAAAAQHFANPIQVMALNLAFGTLAFFGLATIYFALSCAGKAQFANGALTTTYLWAAACSFGVASNIPAFDAVNLFDLSWALNQGLAWQVVAFWLLAATLPRLAVALHLGLKSALVLLTRFGGIYAVVVLAFAIALAKNGSNFLSRWQALFLGQNDSLVGYCAIQLLIYFLASVTIVKFLETTADDQLHRQIRVGSHQKIIARQLLKMVGMSLLGTTTIVGATAGAFVLSGSQLDIASAMPTMLNTAFGLWLTLVTVTCIGLVAVAFTKAIQNWFWLMAALLLMGYHAFFPLGQFDIFALYSSPKVGGAASWLPGRVTAVVLLALSVGVLFSMKSCRVFKSFKIASQWNG
ncbi:MAG: hypothetical protein RL196_1558 [Actinomycetota bacterium]|jgi:hypothetical protein